MSIAPAYPILSGISIFLVLLPLPWHWKARNTGTLLYILWTVIGNVIFTTNTIIWKGNFEDRAPVWCDISSKAVIGLSIGLTASSLCINRRLYNIATIKSVSVDVSSRRKDAIIDLLLGIGLPIVVMALHYVVQGRRYSIIEDLGCWPNTYNTLLAVPMVMIWPIIISSTSLVYCCLSIRAFLQTRQQFNQVLNNSRTGINMSRYFRLMALASTDIVFCLPFATYLLVAYLQNEQAPWFSWADTHWKFSEPILFPAIIIKSFPNGYKALLINVWIMPVAGLLFFIYFGLGGEAFVAYKALFYKLLAPFGIHPKADTPGQNSTWRQQISSAGATSSRGREPAFYPSLPEQEEHDEHETEKVNDDLEAGKARSM